MSYFVVSYSYISFSGLITSVGEERAIFLLLFTCHFGGARWSIGRVSDSGARGWGFDTYLRRVVSFSKIHLL